jgi:hypothetical protein
MKFPSGGLVTKAPINTKVSGDISEKAATYLSNTFRTKHAGLLYVLEVFPALHRYCVKALKGAFTSGELCLIVEAFWDQYLQPEMAGEQLKAKVEKAIVLGRKDEKWGIQPKKLMAKIAALPLPERIFLEIWAAQCWLRGYTDIPDYAQALAGRGK